MNVQVRACNPNGEFTVCWDPLDGSSIVDNNWAVGTMIGVWGSKSGTGADGLIGATGRDQVCAPQCSLRVQVSAFPRGVSETLTHAYSEALFCTF